MKKILITGATGFVGSHLVDRLLKKGNEVHAMVRSSSNLRWLKGKKLSLHQGGIAGDLRSLEKALEGVDILYHVAGVIRARQKSVYEEVNVTGTENVLKTCLKIT